MSCGSTGNLDGKTARRRGGWGRRQFWPAERFHWHPRPRFRTIRSANRNADTAEAAVRIDVTIMPSSRRRRTQPKGTLRQTQFLPRHGPIAGGDHRCERLGRVGHRTIPERTARRQVRCRGPEVARGLHDSWRWTGGESLHAASGDRATHEAGICQPAASPTWPARPRNSLVLALSTPCRRAWFRMERNHKTK